MPKKQISAESQLGHITIIPYQKPQGAKEYFVDVTGTRYTVWEFPFNYFKKFANTSLKHVNGMIFSSSKLIILDSNLKKKEKKWVLRHEMAHAYRFEHGQHLGQQEWDEFECELLAAGELELDDLQFSNNHELLSVLHTYMRANPEDPHGQARKLTNFLKEAIREQEAKPTGIAGLPEDSVQSGKQRRGTTDYLPTMW